MAPITQADASIADRRTLTARLLVLLATIALAVGMVGPVGVLADEDDDDTVTIDVERTAYWTNSAAEAPPPILVSEFPPGVICIVMPEFCARFDDVQDAISDGMGEDEDVSVDDVRAQLLEEARDQHSPIQPVQPDTLPTGRMAGVPRYVSALAFDLPPTPEGQEIVRFELILTEAQPTYAVDSPAFRQAVFAALVGIQEQHPEPAIEEFLKIVQNPDTHPPVDDTVMELEACPTVEDWEAGGNQTWDEQPGVDCILGATGQRDDDDGTWRFDLTFAAQAWDDGMLDNTGLYFGPLFAANLAFGDPDTSDNAQVSLAAGADEAEIDDAPVAIIEYADVPEPLTFDDAPPPGDTAVAEPATTQPATGDVFGRTDPQLVTTTQDRRDPPEPVEAPEAAPEQQPQIVAAQQAQPTTPWYAWLTLLAGLAGLAALGQALAAEPALAAQRSGAMTRLIEQHNGAGTGPDPMTKV